MKTNYILIDYENVPVKSLALLKGDHFRVKVFLGPKNTKLATEFVLAMKALGDKADFIVLEAGGPNALDFHITYYLGRMIAADPSGFYHIISKDTGFDGLVSHIHKTGVFIQRSISIESMPCFAKAPAGASVVKGDPVASPAAAAVAMPSNKKKADELVALVVANLQKRATGRPRTDKTLRSTVKTLIGATYSEKELDAVLARLQKRGFVTITSGKVVYCLDGDE
jgi:hypothetical protein